MSQVEQDAFTPPASENRLALVIGVNRAPHAQTPTLQNELKATEDAEAMAEVLAGPHSRFNLIRPPLLGEAATSADVKKAILDLASHCEPGDFLLLYFAGHGYPMRVRDDLSDVFLVTDDFNEYQAKRDPTLHLSMSWIREQLYEAWERDTGKAAGKVLLIFDCCKAGNFGRGGEDHYLAELKASINYYFGVPSEESGFPPGRLRYALASTGHGQDAGEQNGHGRMTALLLDVLRGKVEETIDLQDYGKVKLWLVLNYLQREMPEAQKPSLSGDDAGKLCVLAQYAELAEAIRQRDRVIVRERPNTYLPFRLSTPMQPRSDELQAVARLLTMQPEAATASVQGPVVGLLGMGGIGKSQLAREVAYDCKDAHRFPAGILWLTITGSDREALQRDLASLCESAEYRPPDDNVLDPENEGRRARHLCRYLAQHSDALLVLDNVDDIDRLVMEDLPFFAGEALRCSILYTSRISPPPSYVKPYDIQKLSEEDARSLLLTYRSAELRQIRDNPQGPLAQDARTIYEYVERLPLALTLLRDLLRDDHLTIAHLREELVRRGTLDVTRGREELIKTRLFQTFEQSWKRVPSTDARRLFQLAASFPEAAPIPLWLLGLVSDLPGLTVLEPLGQAREELYTLSLIEKSPDGEAIRVHPLIREFGQTLNSSDPLYARLQAEAYTRLIGEFAHINKLEQRARAKGYWNCLSDVQVALRYAQPLSLDRHQARQFERIAYWLARDSDLLANTSLWPKELPALFYQQLSNRLFEEGYQLAGTLPSSPWVRQLNHVGAGDQLLMQELRHPNEVTSVVFSPDGRKVLTGCVDGVARLWDLASGRALRDFPRHDDEVMRAVFSPDGTLVVTCSRDYTARIYECASGRLLHTLREHTAAIQSLAFSPNGNYVATASEDYTVCVWNVSNGKMDFFLAAHRDKVMDVAFSPDNQSLVSCSLDGKVYLWDYEREQVRETVLEVGDYVASVAFSPLGNFVLIGCCEGALLWDVHAKRIQKRFATDYFERACSLTQVTCSPNEEFLAVSSSANMVQVWQISTGLLWGTFPHSDMVADVAFSPDGTLLATASLGYTASIWSLPTQPATLPAPRSSGKIGATRFSGNGVWLVAATNESHWQLWHVQDEQLVLDMPLPLDEGYKVTGNVAISDDGTLVCVGFFNRIFLWDRARLLPQTLEFAEASLKHQFTFASGVSLSPDGRFIASGATDEVVRILDVRSRRVVDYLRGHRGDITTIMYAPDGRSLVTGSTDGTARVWQLQDAARPVVLSGHVGVVTALCISPDGKLIATGDLNGNVYLWSLAQGRLLASVKPNPQRVTSLAFSPDSRFLLSCDLLGQVLFWSLQREASAFTLSMVAWYVAPREIGAAHWGEPRSVLLADTGGTDARPHFYRLALEGSWDPSLDSPTAR